MLNFGNADNHGNGVDYGDFNALDNPSEYSAHIWMQKRVDVAVANRVVAVTGLWNPGTSGYFFEMDLNQKLDLGCGDGAYRQATGPSTTALDNATMYAVGWTWAAAGAGPVAYYLQGAADGTANLNNTPNGNNDPKGYCACAGGAGGVGCYAGQLMIWDKQLSGANMTTLQLGANIPEYANLRLWSTGKAVADPEKITGQSATTTGTVTFYAHAVDGYYESPGGFAYLLAEVWAPLLGLSGLFGAAMKYESLAAIPLMRTVMRCAFFSNTEDYSRILEAIKGRPAWVF